MTLTHRPTYLPFYDCDLVDYNHIIMSIVMCSSDNSAFLSWVGFAFLGASGLGPRLSLGITPRVVLSAHQGCGFPRGKNNEEFVKEK